MDVFILLLTIAGATALFLYGMKLMSESLQKILGERIRLILTSMTSNKFKGVMTGLFITALIQSSSATTVMVVSFVNAGILRLFEAVSIIMGANIGTTFTAWLIAFFGFKIDFSLYTLPLIGLSIPFLFSNRRRVKNWGEMLLGFSLLFIALSFLKAYLPGAGESLVGDFVHRLTGIGYFSYLLFLLVGTVITMLIRSSNAILALTLVLVFNGWIGFEHGAAMVLGENIGTTIAAITAARVANLTAKRAAMAHLYFNLFGVIWVILVFPFFLKGVAMLYMSMGGGDPFTNKTSVPIALALFHTSFNVINALLLSGFSGSIARFVTRRVTPGPNYDNEFRLTHIKIGLLSTPDASLYQAKRETVLFAERVRKMFLNVERAFSESNEKEFQKLIEKIHDDEEFANRLEKEIAKYLTSVGEGRLSENSSRRMRSLFKMIDDIESIADSCVNIANAIQRKRNAKINFPDSINYNVQLIFNMVRAALDMMVTMLTHNEELPLSMAQETEREINNYRDILKSEHLNNLEKGLYKYDAGIIYNDIISQCERIGDFAINVDEAQNNLY